ncbi:hypothetical protein RvY_18325-2 [Ramazzottius varieornatus]|uniref:Uncharacterized protein n=1 Tax=Ramazzottius varieornatus TaxID=947166 RepID=A0A1D1W5V3_RAMVA|nr:hypothetical protein RvY_18325-2 [Ramazzottius varieornatus]
MTVSGYNRVKRKNLAGNRRVLFPQREGSDGAGLNALPASSYLLDDASLGISVGLRLRAPICQPALVWDGGHWPVLTPSA